MPLQKKLDDLEAQNAALWQQNEELKSQLARIEAVYIQTAETPEN